MKAGVQVLVSVMCKPLGKNLNPLSPLSPISSGYTYSSCTDLSPISSGYTYSSCTDLSPISSGYTYRSCTDLIKVGSRLDCNKLYHKHCQGDLLVSAEDSEREWDFKKAVWVSLWSIFGDEDILNRVQQCRSQNE